MSFHKNIFLLAHSAFDHRFMKIYKGLLANQSKDYQQLITDQNTRLREFISIIYDSVPYYQQIFLDLNISPKDIQQRKDLEKLPILTKQKIRDNFKTIVSKNLSKQKYYENRTSGSTGDPLRYFYSKYDRVLGGCMLYRGWSYGGYELGDKMAFLAGSSLGLNYKSKVEKFIHETTRNIRKLSSFDMDENNMREYREILNDWKPKFIRGYVSSIHAYAQWLLENQLSIHAPIAIFTTAERLLPHMRQTISKAFNSQVYDNYGLNDGGISAYELPDHSGLKIDTERAILEVIDDDGKQITEGTGRIIATGLHNTALPFIRYDTGDYGTISIKPDGTHVLTEIIGRQEEMLRTPEGKIIHGVFFGYVFRALNDISNYQVIQEDLYNLTIKLVTEKDFDMSQMKTIREYVGNRSKAWKLHFEFVDVIDTSEAGKYRYVFSRLKDK